MTPIARLVVLAIALCLSACGGSDSTAPTPEPIITPAQVREHLRALPAQPPAQDPRQVALGKLLFWDPLLSVAQDTACASCHHPDFDYGDGLFASLGTGASGLGPARSGGLRTPRNAPTVVNTVFNGLTQSDAPRQQDAPMFWDNRRRSLEAQAEQPLLSEIEMRGNSVGEDAVMPLLLARLNANPEYRQRFAEAYGVATIEREQLLGALAVFQRSLVSNNTPFDRFMRGDASALDAAQQRGLKAFIEVGCVACHGGPMLSDYQLHVLGAPDHLDNPNGVDRGGEDRFAFRTPSLRNLARTAPYAHSGTRDTLRELLNFYVAVSRGVSHHSQVAPAELDTRARALTRVDSAVEDLLAFLQALNDRDFDRAIPAAVPSGLPVGGAL